MPTGPVFRRAKNIGLKWDKQFFHQGCEKLTQILGKQASWGTTETA